MGRVGVEVTGPHWELVRAKEILEKMGFDAAVEEGMGDTVLYVPPQEKLLKVEGRGRGENPLFKALMERAKLRAKNELLGRDTRRFMQMSDEELEKWAEREAPKKLQELLNLKSLLETAANLHLDHETAGKYIAEILKTHEGLTKIITYLAFHGPPHIQKILSEMSGWIEAEERVKRTVQGLIDEIRFHKKAPSDKKEELKEHVERIQGNIRQIKEFVKKETLSEEDAKKAADLARETREKIESLPKTAEKKSFFGRKTVPLFEEETARKLDETKDALEQLEQDLSSLHETKKRAKHARGVLPALQELVKETEGLTLEEVYRELKKLGGRVEDILQEKAGKIVDVLDSLHRRDLKRVLDIYNEDPTAVKAALLFARLKDLQQVNTQVRVYRTVITTVPSKEKYEEVKNKLLKEHRLAVMVSQTFPGREQWIKAKRSQ